VDEYKMLNRGIDAIQTERKFFQVCRRIDQLTEELEEFRKALFDDSECGLSAKELYLTSNPNLDGINITQSYQQFHFDTVNDFVNRLKQYVRYASLFEGEDYPWRNRVSFSAFTLSDLKEIIACVEDVPAFQSAMRAQLEEVTGASLNLEDCEVLSKRRTEVDEMVTLLADETSYQFFKTMVNETDDELFYG
jgi:hypothetical protein